LNISDDIEDDTQTVEFQDRLVRYTAMTMTPTEVDDLLEQNFKDVVADLFAPDSEDTEAEIAFLLAVKRVIVYGFYQSIPHSETHLNNNHPCASRFEYNTMPQVIYGVAWKLQYEARS